MTMNFLLAAVIIDEDDGGSPAMQYRYLRIEHITDFGPGLKDGTTDITFVGGHGVTVRGRYDAVMRSIAEIVRFDPAAECSTYPPSSC